MRLAQFTPRLAQSLSGLTHLATCGAGAGGGGGAATASAPGDALAGWHAIHLLPDPSPLLPACVADLIAARPRRRAGLPLWEGLRHLASLRELRIESQGGGDLPASVLACSGLTALSLITCDAANWPVAGLHRYGQSSASCCLLWTGRLCCRRLARPCLVRARLNGRAHRSPALPPAQLWTAACGACGSYTSKISSWRVRFLGRCCASWRPR